MRNKEAIEKEVEENINYDERPYGKKTGFCEIVKWIFYSVYTFALFQIYIKEQMR